MSFKRPFLDAEGAAIQMKDFPSPEIVEILELRKGDLWKGFVSKGFFFTYRFNTRFNILAWMIKFQMFHPYIDLVTPWCGSWEALSTSILWWLRKIHVRERGVLFWWNFFYLFGLCTYDHSINECSVHPDRVQFSALLPAAVVTNIYLGFIGTRNASASRYKSWSIGLFSFLGLSHKL